MATHEELTLIRDARAGDACAQLGLGMRYLGGSAALPTNLDAAMHWLGAAAQQGSIEACSQIARHIPLDCALAAQDAATLAAWFEHAFEAGTTEAGLLFARLVLQNREAFPSNALHERAQAALQTAAHCGDHEAQWLWAAELRRRGDCADMASTWEARAAQGGLEPARLALAEQACAQGDRDAALHWALPIARMARNRHLSQPGKPVAAEQRRAAALCAQLLSARAGASERDIKSFWECAAASGDAAAQIAYGTWLSGMTGDGIAKPARLDHDEAAQWLVMAGRQGLVEAWYALSRLYRPGLHPRPNPELQRHYRQKAAEAGHRQAQYECGIQAWNNGEGRASSMVRAQYWLEMAAGQGCKESKEMLRHIRQANAEKLCQNLIASHTGGATLFTA